MVNLFNKSLFPKRRAVSTIVGGAIFLVLLSSGFSAFYVAMEVQRDTITTQQKISNTIMEKAKEKFEISPSIDKNQNNRLSIQVKNLGTNPVEVGNIWIINKSGSYPAENYTINYADSVIPQGYGADILATDALYMIPDDYDIKVISTLGTIEKAEFTVGGNNHLRASMFAIPPDVRINKNITLTMHVENIGNQKLTNVKPTLDIPDISIPFDPPNPPTPVPVDLEPGESIFFTWDLLAKASGLSAGNFVTFVNNATGTLPNSKTVQSSNATDAVKLLEPDTSEIIVLTSDLFSRPEIFMVIPSPMGTGAGTKAVWGANIVNPTSAPMEVSRFTVTLLSPRENNSDLMFNPTSAPNSKCDPEAVGSVTASSEWACQTQNQLSWTAPVGSPVTIPPFSAAQFTAKVHADRLSSGGVEIPSVVVVGDVFTNVGEFSKAGYSSSFDDGGTAIANVYLSTEEWSTENDEIITTHLGIQSGSVVTFNATLTDFEPAGSVIEDGAKFIINIPKGFIIQDWVNDIDGLGDFTISYSSFPDTSSQIIGELITDYDGTGHGPDSEGLSIQFTATAPTVTNEQMYIMYVLAEGQVDAGDFAMGPLTEVVLQVVP